VYGNVILPVALYGCEIWCILFVGRTRLWVFGKEVKKNILPKRKKVTRVWRR